MFPRSRTINGIELIEKWNTDLRKLSYFILKLDLIVLDPSTTPKFKISFNPNDNKIDSAKLLDIIQNNPVNLSGMLFWLPEIERLTVEKNALIYRAKDNSPGTRHRPRFPDLTPTTVQGRYRSPKSPKPSTVVGRYCRKSKSKDQEKEAKISENTAVQEKDTQLSADTLKDVIEIHEENIKNHSNVFSLMGKVWFVKFNQEEWGLYPDQKKYKYIAHLLNLAANDRAEDKHEVSISNLNLNICVDPKDIRTEKSNYPEDGLGELDSSDQFSKEEIKSIKQNLNNLLNRIELAKDYDDEALQDNAKEELYSYAKILKQQGVVPSIKDGGKKITLKCQTRLDKGNEKIRQLVKNNIRNAIRDFNDRMPGFREHLEHFCKTKLTETIYHPIPPTSWFVTF